MSTRHLIVGAAVFVFAAGAARAQDGRPAPAEPLDDAAAMREYVRSLEKRLADLEGTREWPLDGVRPQAGSALEAAVRSIDVSGRLEFEYSLNFRRGGAVRGRRGDTLNFNQLRGPDADENGFSFTELELNADKALTTDGSTGFHVSADWGVVSRQADVDPNFDAGAGANALDVREAFFSWRARFQPTGHVDVSVGKMRSPLGFEAFGGYGLNWLVTRNPIGVFGTPGTHMGLRATAPLSEMVTTSLWFVNGWDDVRDASDGKNAIWNVTLGKFDWLSSTVSVSVAYGVPEGDAAHQGDDRTLVDMIWTGSFSEDLEFALDAVAGHQPERTWHGVAAYLRQKLGEKTVLSFRGGWYADEALGTSGARILDGSIAVGREVAEDVTLALEFRHDYSRSGGTFLDASGNPARSQDTLTAAFVYRF